MSYRANPVPPVPSMAHATPNELALHRWAGEIFSHLDRLAQERKVEKVNATYTIADLTADRTYDADSTSTAELADVLGTLINDLKLGDNL